MVIVLIMFSREGNFCPQMLPQMLGWLAWPRLCGCCAAVADDGIGVRTIAVPGLMSIIHPAIPVPWCECQQILLPSCPHGQSQTLATSLQYCNQGREKGIGKCLYKSGSKMKYNGLVKQLTKSLSVVSPPINNCLQNVNFHFKKRICAGEFAWHRGGLSSWALLVLKIASLNSPTACN